MSGERVLLIETSRTSAPSFAHFLERRGYTLAIEHSVGRAIRRAQMFDPALLILDAASLRTSGVRMCRQVKHSLNGVRIVLVVGEDITPDPRCGADSILVQPFTPRKLLNAVHRLLPVSLQDGWLQAGPIQLNVTERRVQCGDRDESLTPKQARLLEVFMRNSGEVISRRDLIKQVWETDYIGDTRTLDVHISWLRRVLERDPRKPRYLKTLRRRGYQLDVGSGPDTKASD